MVKIRRIALSAIVALCLTLIMVPMTLYASATEDVADEDSVEEVTEVIYINPAIANNTNSSLSNSGTVTCATLADAADMINLDSGKSYTIYIRTSYTATSCARFYNNNVTIIGMYDGVTITRGEYFATLSDTARSWYNPAMIEIGVTDDYDGTVSLTLKNITLDDNAVQAAGDFAQAGSSTASSGTIVQDAIVASYTSRATIILDEGATLKNYGGMSAVRVAGAKLIMKSGSVICDDDTTTKHWETTSSSDYDSTYTGAAGAIWCQSGTVIMRSGSKISNMTGRAIYMDGGTAEISGTITGITGSANMHQCSGTGGTGIAIHLRNAATVVMKKGAEISEVVSGNTGKTASAVYLTDQCSFTMDDGSVIKNLNSCAGIFVDVASGASVYMNGEICALGGTNQNYSCAINLNGGTAYCCIGATGYIHDNYVYYGAVYMQGIDSVLDIYGRINNNYSSGKGGALSMANNYGLSTTNMYEGAEMCGNYSVRSGGAVMVAKGTFNLYGGTISGNYSKGNNAADEGGGAVSVEKGGYFYMYGGSITGNYATRHGGAVAMKTDDVSYNGQQYSSHINLLGGTISGNYQFCTISATDALSSNYVADMSVITVEEGVANELAIYSDNSGKIGRYMNVTDNVELGVQAIYMVTGSKYVTLNSTDAVGVKLGNASTSSVTALNSASAAKGWDTAIATLWTQHAASSSITVSGVDFDSSLPVYVLIQETGEDGEPADGASVSAYTTTVADDAITFTVPTGNANGYAVALVQPTTDSGTAAIETSAAVLAKNDRNEDGSYTVPYTVTYTISKTIVSQLAYAGEATATLTIELDSALTADDTVITIDLVNMLSELDDDDDIEITLDCTATLAAESFVVDGTLDSTTSMTITIVSGDKVTTTTYDVPGNVASTEMVDSIWTVTFVSNGGTDVAALKVSDGGNISAPVDPEREGYNFNGWYTDENLTTEYVFETPIYEDITLYAGWTQITYSVEFDANGGSAVETQTVGHGDTATEPSAPTRDGYSFVGWYTDAELTQAYDFNEAVVGDLTLYAAWEIMTLTVSFDTDGGSEVAAQSVTYGESATQPEDPTREGYEFIGWYTEGYASEYDFDEEVTQDITVYALWDAIIADDEPDDEDPDAEVEPETTPDEGPDTVLADITKDADVEEDVDVDDADEEDTVVEDETKEVEETSETQATATGESNFIVLLFALLCMSAAAYVALSIVGARKVYSKREKK